MQQAKGRMASSRPPTSGKGAAGGTQAGKLRGRQAAASEPAEEVEPAKRQRKATPAHDKPPKAAAQSQPDIRQSGRGRKN